MNIFLREMKAGWKSLMFWTLGMVALIGVSMWEYEGLTATGNAMSQIMAIYPKSLKALFGMSVYDIGTLFGYFGIIMLFVYVVAGLHAVMLGANLIAKEEREKTAEFLMVKPVTWENILIFKMLAGLVNILIVNLAAWVVSAATVSYFSDEHVGAEVFSIQVLMFLFQLLFLWLGAFMASILKTSKAGQFATFIFLGFYFIKVMADLLDSEVINYFTPFGFLGAQKVIIDEAAVPGWGGLIVLILVAGMSWWAYRKYPQKDIL